jgi:hypothetical protein
MQKLLKQFFLQKVLWYSNETNTKKLKQNWKSKSGDLFKTH